MTITSPHSPASPTTDIPTTDIPTTDIPDLGDDEAGALLGADVPWRRFVGLGDSVVEGVRDPAPGYRDLSWVDRLVGALRSRRPELVDRNLGQRGLLTADVHRRQLPEALHFGPDLTAVVAGGNDIFRDRFDAAAVESELEAMVEPLRTGGSDVVTLGLFDISRIDPSAPTARLLQRRIRTLAELTAAVAERHGAVHVDFSTHPAGNDPSIYSTDRLHINARGHALVATETLRRLARHTRHTRRTGR